MDFSEIILRWYQENKRDLPWRSTREPYKIWLSEVMLQQTRVAQGLPYYQKFVEEFPTVFDMAKAPEEQILKLWQGLGYYSRARNMHATAKMVVNELGGNFPTTHKELLKLKGVGDYTASAIASICFNEPAPVVDGNVYRVLARYFGIDIPINSTDGIKYFKGLAKKLMATTNVRDYNQGIMEFGAIQCAPKSPNCKLCPLQSSCVAFAENRITELPVKLKKTKVKHRYFNYMVFVDDAKKTALEKREGKGIWQHLYQFPLIEAEEPLNIQQIEDRLKLKGQLYKKVYLFNSENIVHKLSHQHIHTKFWIVAVTKIKENAVSFAKAKEFPVPVLIAQFMERFKF
ncbi:A/G-specific adenine glycosylase [Croceivirga sp. JEA036]|uniref:A/G-specific adenine glycosylase n=1 Tax=Croceivirga sp. JEA036 TaxID=2721162 RepID=UPI0014397D17|nr:A/G-specific adenine glycosylase [Croceivirga sp. JEA036]NJB36836.1 A/G-specific adenine glycosylase [Croceivirga sp. JEA036]